MRRMVTLLLLLTLLSANGATVKAQSLLKENPLPSSRLLNRYGLELGWWAQATVRGRRDKIAHVAVDERSVAVLTSSGLLSLFDAETGQKMWTSSLGRGDQAALKPVMNDKLVMAVVGLNLYAMDRATGRVAWELDLPRMPSTGPSADDNQVYVGTLDGSVYAFDLRKIRELYLERLLPDYSLSTRVWRYKAGEKITSPPVPSGRAVLFASLDASLYAVTATSRKLLYQFETDAPVSAPLVQHKGNVYLASQDFNFYCLNAANGQVRWSFLSGLQIRKSPHVIETRIDDELMDIVYILPELGGINAVIARNGRELWTEPQLRAQDFLAATDNNVFVTDQIGNVLLLSPRTGAVNGVLPLVSFNRPIQNDRTDRVFLSREDGLMVMIREEGKTFPTYHQFPERRPILPQLYDGQPVNPAEGAEGEDGQMDQQDQPGQDKSSDTPGDKNDVDNFLKQFDFFNK